MTSLSFRASLAVLLVLFLPAGCSRKYFEKSADKQVYRIIKDKSALVRNTDPHFTLEQTNALSLEAYPIATNVVDFLGPDGERERGARRLTLADALGLGIRTSRAYQSRKEQLYLSALSLTLARHQFAPIFSASGTVNYQVETERAVTIGVDEITGQAKPVFSDSLVEQHRIQGSADVGASWLIRDVGRVTAAFTTDALRFITGDGKLTTSSQLSATFVRPLLKNAAFKQEMENLTQAERQVLYDLRDFTQYRKDFSVQIAQAYYGVLGLRDAARNSFLNLQSSRKNAERSRAMAQEGRITQADLGRLEQQELSAQSSWINAVRGYQQSLDSFKFLLGLEVSANLVLDDHELDTLQILHPSLSAEDSIQVALAARLDYLNAKDELADAERKVELAANFLKPQLDFNAGVAINSDTTQSGFVLPDPGRYRWNAGLAFDPVLDRLAERNSYRSALISRNRSARAVAQQADQITQQVRDSWRTLDQAKLNYEISENEVRLSERRVEEQNLLAELGRARAQDQVDAQNDLSNSKNRRTQALVTHTVSRLQFWDNLGILYIKDNGQFEEIQNASR